MVQQWATRRLDDRIATNADQVEFAAMRYASSNAEAGTYDDRVAGALDDYELAPPTPLADWAEHDIALENATGDIVAELRRRENMLEELYPFELNGNGLVYKSSRTLAYEFCLAVSLSISLVEGEFAMLPIAFERLVRDALVCFLGPGARGFRTGWPADEHEERPVRFRQLMQKLHALTDEFIWHPAPGLPDDPAPRDVKDEGLDVVVWKEVPDRRGGKLVLLGQCACGNGYETKLHEIDSGLHRLRQWMRPVTVADPLRVFATCRHVANDFQFAAITTRAGLTLDRTRITLIAESDVSGDYVTEQAKIPYRDLIELVISGFEAA